MAQAHSQTLDLVLLYAKDVGLSSSEKLAVAGEITTSLAAVYGTTGLAGQLDGNEKVIVWPVVAPEMNVNTHNKSNSSILSWMKTQNLIPASPLSVARENFGNGGADVVMMVTKRTSGPSCGAAYSPPTLAGVFNSETHAFAIVTPEELDSECLDEIVAPHELGHVLYAEHQVALDSKPSTPAPDNHGTKSNTSNLKSLMWDAIGSNNTSFLSGRSPNFTTASADNVDWMSRKSFDVVSSYRPKQQTEQCEIEVTACINGGPHDYDQLITPKLTGHTVVNQKLYKGVSGGGWQQLYNGNLNCVANPIFSSTLFKAVLTTVAGLLSECEVTVYPEYCFGEE